MNTLKPVQADILALDSNNEPVMIVEVKAVRHIGQEVRDGLAASLQSAKISAPYVMLVDLQLIQIFNWNGARLQEPLLQIPTVQALSFYDSDFASKEIFGYYLEKLVEGWLHDLAYHWKSPTPPGYTELGQIGLVELLRDGTTIEVDKSQNIEFLAA